MQQHTGEFQQKDVKIVVVTFEKEPAASAFQCSSGLPWPLLIDAEKTLYTAYGMAKAGFKDVWGFRTLKAYLMEIARGRLPKKSGGDIYQRGGDILVDPQGIVRLHHVGTGPADRPSVESILALIK